MRGGGGGVDAEFGALECETLSMALGLLTTLIADSQYVSRFFAYKSLKKYNKNILKLVGQG